MKKLLAFLFTGAFSAAIGQQAAIGVGAGVKRLEERALSSHPVSLQAAAEQKVTPVALRTVISKEDAVKMGIQKLTAQEQAAWELFLGVIAKQVKDETMAANASEKQWVSSIGKNGVTITLSNGHTWTPAFDQRTAGTWGVDDAVMFTGEQRNLVTREVDRATLINLTKGNKIEVKKVR